MISQRSFVRFAKALGCGAFVRLDDAMVPAGT
jgi:hypothetical protein